MIFNRFYLRTKLQKLQKSCRARALNHNRPIILGIETSCDDTGCAVVDSSGQVLGEALYSQSVVHLRLGGINPIIAREYHRDHIGDVTAKALRQASVKIDDLDAIAVTTKPGLLASLDIGVKYARYISRLHKKILIPIHHMEAHALVARMYNQIEFPFLVLLISGGHCLLALANGVDDFILLGDSLDNSPGEMFDKVARRMKLRNIPEYSKMCGGEAIQTAASKARNPKQFEFPLILAREKNCNFSFSGIRDSVTRKLIIKEEAHNIIGDGIIPEINDLCAAFQMAIAKHLVHRTQRAAEFCEIKELIPDKNKTLVVSGGVACNNFIFKCLETFGEVYNYRVIRPPPRVCTDNGIMIAWNGIEKYKIQSGLVDTIEEKDIEPKAPLGRNLISEVKQSLIPVKVVRLKF